MNFHLPQSSMTSKERVLRTLNYEKTDRVPINYSANPGIDRKLKKYSHCNFRHTLCGWTCEAQRAFIALAMARR